MIQRSASSTQTCHLFCNYAVRDLGCDSSSCCRARFPSTLLTLTASSFHPSFVPKAGDVSRSYTPASKSFRVSGATVKNIQNQLCPRPRYGAFAKGDESGIYICAVGSRLCRCSFRDLFIALHGQNSCPIRLFLMDRLTSSFFSLALERDRRGRKGEIAEIRGSVTNYLNDRSRTSDLRLISEALFDDRTRAESG